MLRRAPFWWGASFALLPTLAGAFSVAYSGSAGINVIWHLLVNRDAPGLPMVLGGILYGISLGVLLPCLLFGVTAHLIWQGLSLRLAASLAHASSPTKVALWIGLQVTTVPISLCFTFGANLLPWLFLSGR
jgi:hypothetical protein